MARQFFTGFALGGNPLMNGFTSTIGTAPTIGTTQARTGAASMIAATAAGSQARWGGTQWAANQAVYFQCSAYLTAVPISVTTIIVGNPNSAVWQITTAGVLQFVANPSGTVLYTTSMTPLLNGWHTYEWSASFPTLTSPTTYSITGWLDGVQIYTSASQATTVTAPGANFDIGPNAALGASYYDDVIVADASGTGAAATRPNGSKVGYSFPAADVAAASWTNTDSQTTTLWDSLNNSPPIGAADATADAAGTRKQIRHASTLTTVPYNYQATGQTYGVAGLGATDTVPALQVEAAVSSTNATATSQPTIGINTTANPVTTQVTGKGGLAAAYPTGWTAVRTAITGNPGVTTAQAPTIQVAKTLAGTTTSADVAFAAVKFEYQAAAVAITPTRTMMGVGT